MNTDPYEASRREYQDRFDELAAGKRHCQTAMYAAMGLAALSLLGNIVQARQVKQVPYVVLADQVGHAITIPQPLTASATR